VILQTEELSVRFRTGLRRRPIEALRAVDLQVREGDFLALLGPNGAGKSTLMYCLLGLLRPTSGTVRLFGASPIVGSRLFGDVSYLPEEPHYHDYLTVEEAVRYYGRLFGRSAPVARVRDLLDRLGLAEFATLRLGRCSKGMKQKVGIAQCLLNDARLMFLDEPMRGLDPLAVAQFRDILVDVNRSGTTIVMNSHILSEVEQVATRVAILDHGRLVAQDTVGNLVRVRSDVYVVAIEPGGELPDGFHGEPAANGTVVGAVAADQLFDFFAAARRSGTTIVSCNRQRSTLEESFLRVVKGASHDA
jgi:ABC-type multidrug transport system ATPase subunit